MNYIKLTENEKIKQREARKEFQIIVKRCRAIGFDYVIKSKPRTKICFDSAMEREILPLNHPLSIRIQTKEINESLGPGHYNIGYYKNQDHPILKTKISKKGYGGLAFLTNRFKNGADKNPTVYSYAKEINNKNETKSHWQPFGKSLKTQKISIDSCNPAPGTYHQTKTRKLIFQHSFGGKIKIKPAVKIICNPINIANCSKCNIKCDGDYWHNFDLNINICRKCMDNDKNILNSLSMMNNIKEKFLRLKELNNFRLVRYCGFYHDHQNTTAARRLLSNIDLKTKTRRENYLSMFNI